MASMMTASLCRGVQLNYNREDVAAHYKYSVGGTDNRYMGNLYNNLNLHSRRQACFDHTNSLLGIQCLATRLLTSVEVAVLTCNYQWCVKVEAKKEEKEKEMCYF